MLNATELVLFMPFGEFMRILGGLPSQINQIAEIQSLVQAVRTEVSRGGMFLESISGCHHVSGPIAAPN